MRFVYHADAGAPEVELEGESFIHIFGSRRTKASETLALRNLRDDMLHTYAIISINRKSARLRLESSARTPCKMSRFTHIIWAITHPQTIQKALPYLNELGLSRLSLFWSEFSQRNAKIELEKLRRILIGSCEQCGRSDMMEIEILRDLDEVLARYERACALDFGGFGVGAESISNLLSSGIIIGAEGGFSQKEREKFASRRIIALDSDLILRSQTAAIAILSKGL